MNFYHIRSISLFSFCLLLLFICSCSCASAVNESNSNSTPSSSSSSIKSFNLLGLNTNNLGNVCKFLTVPQRHFLGVTKNSNLIFKTELPYRFFVSEQFGIYELLSSKFEQEEDLIWFTDKLEIYKNNPSHFFLLLTHAIFIDKKFTINENLLCRYFIRQYRNSDLLLLAGLLQVYNYSNHEYDLSSAILNFLNDRGHFDILVSIFLDKDKSTFFTKNSSLYRNFGIQFYKELMPNLRNKNGELTISITDFFELFDFENCIDMNKKSFLMGRILCTDECEILLFENEKENGTNNENIIDLIKDSFRNFIFEFGSIQKSSLRKIDFLSQIEIQDLDEIFKRNLRILSRATALAEQLVDNTSRRVNIAALKSFMIYNEIYFGPENAISVSFIQNNPQLIEEMIKSSFYYNKTELFSKLLSCSNGLCFDWIQENANIFNFNLNFFFEFNNKFPDWNKSRLLSATDENEIFSKITKFYGVTDCTINHSESISLNFIFKLKQLEPQSNNLNLPLSFTYNIHKSRYEAIKFYNICMENFSGNEELFIMIFDYFKSFFKNGTYDFLSTNISDELLLIILTSSSEKIAKMKFYFRIESKQFLRFFEHKNSFSNLSHKFIVQLDDSVVYKSDSDFKYLESYFKETIPEIFQPYSYFDNTSTDSCKLFKLFMQYRNILYYLFRNDNGTKQEIRKFNRKIIEFLEKETGLQIN